MHRIILFLGTVVLMASACNHDKKLIESPTRITDIRRMLEVQKKLTSHSRIPLWNIFDQPMTGDEKQAMEFLYAYMPLSDLADYPPSFFLAAVKQSLKARKELSWSTSVPEDIFLQYVLPLRVNNENLDSFRLVMYAEIRDRVKDLDMTGAALEINHWCHEKVNYHGTDIRTSAPLSIIKKSFGRCGEETTFTVSAMRTAGIPARQVYTPRWAHVDDNHAWVEIWVNGKWNYLGACEPEPVLNMGWFSEPSRRTMLVHTRVYGRYFGNDEVITPDERFSELNLTGSYAPVKKLTVVVRNKTGEPVDSATVAFGLYNYAEFYPIATKYADNRGITKITTGMGNLLVWATEDKLFDYRMISVPETDTVILILDKSRVSPHTEVYDLVPPHAVAVNSSVSDNQRTENNTRLALEDSIRNTYISTFKDSAWSASLAQRLLLNADTVHNMMSKAYGNWPEITRYLEINATAFRSTVLSMASQLSDKDFSDATEAVLTDHLRQAVPMGSIERPLYEKWLLSPRIDNEKLSPWRGFLKSRLHEFAGSVQDMPEIIQWIQDSIALNDMANMHSRAPITPVGVYNLRVSDSHSRDIFYVAACRSLGIPARLNPVTRITEYADKGKWIQVSIGKDAATKPAVGSLSLTQKGNPVMPQYYTHFTLAKLNRGIYHTLEFEEGRKLSDFPSPLVLDTGQYLLVTGNRLENGTVLSTLTFFTLGKGRWTTVPVSLRVLPGETKPSGKLNLDALQLGIQGEDSRSLADLSSGKRMVIILLDPDKEPSKHVLDELGSYAAQFNHWNGRFLFVMPPHKINQARILEFFDLPSDNLQGTDLNSNILNDLEKVYGPGLKDRLPLVALCDKDGNVFFFSAGYKIGLGEQLLKLTQ
jgi:hypothetical protein